MVVFVCLSSLCSALAVQLSYIALAAAIAQGWTLSQTMEIPVQWKNKCGSNEKHALPEALCDTLGHLQKGEIWWAYLVLAAISHIYFYEFTSCYIHSLWFTAHCVHTQTWCTHYNSLHSLTNLLFPFLLLIAVFLCCRYWWMCFRFSPV